MRGCQKRVVFLKNTGSSIFEGAYFVIKDENRRDEKDGDECDMVLEASRIIEENFERKGRRTAVHLYYALSFILGAAFSATVLFFVFS